GPFFFVKPQRIAESFGDRFFRQVVPGGAQPAGKQQQAAAAAGLGHQFPQAVGVVPDDVLMQHTDAQFGQFPAQKLGVGVEDVPQQQFRPDADDLSRHSSSSSPMRIAIFSTFSAASASSAARSGIAASAARISSSVGLVLGWGGVKMVQQSS